ncbi:MAG: hypothetical protein KDD33_12480 [Bdellovibrionales bacterium]|nr:hypothetical protein [Bdellovibrionales bacterium]
MLLLRGMLFTILVVLAYRNSHGAGLFCSEIFKPQPPILQSLVEKAERLVEQGEIDAKLAQKLIAEANKGIDISNPSPSPLHMRAFAAAGKLKGQQARWTLVRRFTKNPQGVLLGEFPDQGIEAVKANVSFLDLQLNGAIKERLMGVTFVIRTTEGDLRSQDLPKVMKTIPMDWNKANSMPAYKRRLSLLHSHKELFDKVADDPFYRVLHSVISLNRLGRDVENFLIPTTEINPLTKLRESREAGMADPYLVFALRDLFLTSLTGKRDVKVMNGYQNGDSRNPRHR